MDKLNEDLDQLELKSAESEHETSSGSENSEEEESSSDDGKYCSPTWRSRDIGTISSIN